MTNFKVIHNLKWVTIKQKKQEIACCRAPQRIPHLINEPVKHSNIQKSSAITSMSTHDPDSLFLSNFLVTFLFQILYIANGNTAFLRWGVSRSPQSSRCHRQIPLRFNFMLPTLLKSHFDVLYATSYLASRLFSQSFSFQFILPWLALSSCLVCLW